MQFLQLLDHLYATREAVERLMASQGVPEDLTGEDLVVRCHFLRLGGPSFADELVRQAIRLRGARSVILVGAPRKFVALVRTSAARRGVEDRITEGLWAELIA